MPDTATINDKSLERQQLSDVTELAAEIKRLLVRHEAILKEEGIRKEMERLEQWLETERKGPAPAGIISQSGMMWLCGLRDRLKLSADESLRLENEAGNVASPEQDRHTEELLDTVRRIDQIIEDSNITTH